jgi:hypothetical protein
MFRHERREGFLLEETLQCGCGHWTYPTLPLSNGPYFENKKKKNPARINVLCVTASPSCAKSTSLHGAVCLWNVFYIPSYLWKERIIIVVTD